MPPATLVRCGFAGQFRDDDVLLRAPGVLPNADDFDRHRLRLVALKYGPGDALHAGLRSASSGNSLYRSGLGRAVVIFGALHPRQRAAERQAMESKTEEEKHRDSARSEHTLKPCFLPAGLDVVAATAGCPAGFLHYPASERSWSGKARSGLVARSKDVDEVS